MKYITNKHISKNHISKKLTAPFTLHCAVRHIDCLRAQGNHPMRCPQNRQNPKALRPNRKSGLTPKRAPSLSSHRSIP